MIPEPQRPALLVSLGTSPAIVPEAFMLPDVPFESVHVLTTAKPDVTLVQEFFAHHFPNVVRTITRVADFEDLGSAGDHFQFEEVLYRWILATGTHAEARYMCLSGGFKTMSAAMQKAAAVLGAAEVFHVLADNAWRDESGRPRGPLSIGEVLEARERQLLHWIRLGGETGWPQLRSARSEDYPLQILRQEGDVRWVSAPGDEFRTRLDDIVQRSHRIADVWPCLDELPFVELATWPAAALRWLREPIEPGSAVDHRWVADLPKIELHCHLGGFATDGALLKQVREGASDPGRLPSPSTIILPNHWPLPPAPVGLESYRRLGDNNGSALLLDPGCLRRQCELLYNHLVDQRVIYAEIRCSPANYADPALDRSPWKVLNEIQSAFTACMGRNTPAARCHVNLIIIGTRQSGGDFRPAISRHLALGMTAAEHWQGENSCRIVGVDLAGYEDKSTRAHYFREEFSGVHRCGLAVTVHAGENDDAEGIWHAIFDLNARRIGHALSLTTSPELQQSIADRGIGLEMCPYANLQIRGYPIDVPATKQRYPLLDYLRAGIRVTINTDNIGISSASLAENLLLAGRLCPGLTRLDLLRCLRHSIDTAFVSPSHRLQLIRSLSTAIPLP